MSGREVLVIGAGVSGAAAARLGRRLGDRVRLFDHQPSALESLAVEGFPTLAGPWDPTWLEGVELVVVSPGVPEGAEPIQDALAAGLPVWSEVELASRHLEAVLVAVTGTNGKTTVTSLTAEMLVASGRKAVAAGNIGRALSDTVGEPWDVVVAEVSSFQLRFIERFHPRVAVVVNVAPDHLDWHGSLEAYEAAKRRIVERQGEDDVLVYDVDDPGAARLAASAPGRLVPVSGRRRPEAGAGPEGAELHWPGAAVPVAALWANDPAFVVDVAAAGAAALEVGATAEGVRRAAAGFRLPPHRRSLVGRWGGVAWVDDSKATNPHAAVAAATAYPSVVLIAGGRNKGLDLGALAEVPSVRHLVAIGEAGPELVEAAGPKRATMVGSLAEAVALADRLARPGDTVLLAPGCASFDMFRSYVERGEAFSAEVLRLKGAP